MKSRLYKKIAQLELDDRCDYTDTLGDLANKLSITPDYLKKDIKLGTYKPSLAVRRILSKELGISLKVQDDHFKDAKRAYKESV